MLVSTVSTANSPALLARTQFPQVMPIEDTVIVPVLPGGGDGVRADRHEVLQPRGRGIRQVHIEDFRRGFVAHFIVTATALGARTASP